MLHQRCSFLVQSSDFLVSFRTFLSLSHNADTKPTTFQNPEIKGIHIKYCPLKPQRFSLGCSLVDNRISGELVVETSSFISQSFSDFKIPIPVRMTSEIRRNMKKASSQPAMRSFEESDGEDEFGSNRKGLKDRHKDSKCNMGNIARMTIQRPESCKRCEEFSCERHGLWIPQQKAKAGSLEELLRASWDLEDLVEEQLKSFQSHYKKSVTPTRLKDVAQLLMPKETPALELAASSWLGDWRPSAILDLLRSLSSSLSDLRGVRQVLPQLLTEIRIEETIIDEEMAEIQANCILHLPFGPMVKKKQDSCRPALDSIQAEFEKIHRVIIKAQNLRIKALELVVKNVLNEADAADFLAAFAGIQNSIHQLSTQNRSQKSPVPQPFKTRGSI